MVLGCMAGNILKNFINFHIFLQKVPSIQFFVKDESCIEDAYGDVSPLPDFVEGMPSTV